MSSAHRLRNLAPLGCAIVSLSVLSSCALPPKQAWQKIRSDGLFAYISYEMRTPRRPLDAPGPVKPIGPASKPILSTPAQPRPLMAQSPTPVAPPQKTGPTRTEGREGTSAPMPPPEGTLTALAVPGLPGYVRSPYTNPPRLIDVKRSTAGSTMVCPYTNKPFIVPDGAGMEPKPSPGAALAERTPDAPVPPGPAPTRPKPSPAKTEDAKPSPLPLKDMAGPAGAPSSNSVSASNQAAGNAVPVAPSSNSVTPGGGTASGKNTAASSNTATGGPASPSATPAPAPAPEIPYGTPIQGRPGYVNSPYAAAHQLVDVTGLPVGMEVKCPYTGKLFRVPPQDMASGKTAPENR